MLICDHGVFVVHRALQRTGGTDNSWPLQSRCATPPPLSSPPPSPPPSPSSLVLGLVCISQSLPSPFFTADLKDARRFNQLVTSDIDARVCPRALVFIFRGFWHNNAYNSCNDRVSQCCSLHLKTFNTSSNACSCALSFIIQDQASWSDPLLV